MDDKELEDQAVEVLRLLHESIAEFVSERVATDSQVYVSHFMGIMKELLKDGQKEKLEAEGTRFVQAYDELHEKLKREYLSIEQIRFLFENRAIGAKLRESLDAAIENKMNEIAAPAFEELVRIIPFFRQQNR